MNKFGKEKTLVLIKPDAVQRTLIGEIIQRFERIGLKLVAMKMMAASGEHIEKHYTLDPEWRRKVGEKTIKSYKEKGQNPPSEDAIEISKPVLEGLVKFMSAGPLIAMVWEGAHAVKIVRKLVGGTEPLSSDVGTIRGDFVLDSYEMADSDNRSIRNLIHASGSPEEAEAEINHWFSGGEVISYRLIQDEVLYDVNLDGILE